MRARSFLLASFLLSTTLFARTGQVSERIIELRAKGTGFAPVRMLEPVAGTERTDARWKEALKHARVYRPIPMQQVGLLYSVHPFVSLEIPGATGGLVLDLERTDISRGELTVVTATGRRGTARPAAHYRGMVRDIPGSWVAVSVFEDEVMGLINDGKDTWVLGRFEDRRDDLHILYRTSDLRRSANATCATIDDGEPYRPDQLAMNGADRTIRCVRYYWEVNYNIYVDKGGLVNTTNYITGLFNQSATLFDNDGIDVVLSEVFVWDVESPYTATTSGGLLSQFGQTRTSFNGDMAHLLGFNGGGGVAYVGTICSSSASLRMAYSGIYSSYSNVPTYSWSVEVVSHEQGHNLGSRHTHACAWNGNATAIDGCGPAAGYTEGTCAQGPLPSSEVGGTVMSYCHLTSSGINFTNGFGPQPAAVIINTVNSATCLGTCGTTCDAPGNLFVQNLAPTTATLAWPAVGAVSYTLRWKAVADITWNTISGLTANTYGLAGLIHSTAYEFQVLSVCASGSSSFSGSYTFTTPPPCPDALEPNNSLAAAAQLNLPVAQSALIAVNGDLDYYRFTLSATSTITVSLTNLPFDYDVRLLNNSGATLASSEAGSTTSEYISYANAGAGTYHVYVFGYNGAFSVDRCYALFVSAYVPQGCAMPEQPVVNGITWNGATANWTASPSVSNFTLRWKPTTGATWTEVGELTTASYTFTGLDALTSYDVQVRSNCVGSQTGTTSEYTQVVTFTTLAVPCEVVPPIKLSLHAILDGAYRSAASMMVDSLRRQEILPLQEPYTALGHIVSGATTTTPAVLAVTGSDAVVDWVLVELRDPASPSVIIEARVGLLQRDGDLSAADGTALLGFCAAPGPYYVALRHRNHLGVLTASAIQLGPATPLLDFSTPSTTTFGTNARRNRSGLMTLWAGNVNRDLQVKYAGGANDRDAILTAIGGVIPTNTVPGYRLEDSNLDGLVKYAGGGNDRDVVLGTIGGVIPTSIVNEQLP